MKNVACTRYFASRARMRGIACAPNSPREIGVGLVIPRAMKPDMASKSNPSVTRWAVMRGPRGGVRYREFDSLRSRLFSRMNLPGKSRDHGKSNAGYRSCKGGRNLSHHQPRSCDPIVQELPVAIEKRPAERNPGRHREQREPESQQRSVRRDAVAPGRDQADLPRL